YPSRAVGVKRGPGPPRPGVTVHTVGQEGPVILGVGGRPGDGRWLEGALRPRGLAVTVRSLEDALAPPPSETRVRPEVLVLHERRRREGLLDSLDPLHAA